MRVLSVSTSDRGGGAEQVAWDLFTGLEARGHESWLAVGQKHSSHPRVFEIHASPWFDYRPFADPRRQASWDRLRRWRHRRGFEDFLHPYSRHLPDLLPQPPEAVIAHNLHGGYFDLRSLPHLSRRLPVALVLHDFWLLTGHCAYPFDCDRWRDQCGDCPHLDTPPAIVRDATRANLRAKRSLYRRSRLVACSPSRQMLDQARMSALGAGVTDYQCIPNGVDLDLFRPGDRDVARKKLGLALHRPHILMIGRNPAGNPFKDFGCAEACARRLAAENRKVVFLMLGGRDASEISFGPVTMRSAPFTDDRAAVADYFRASDLLLHATRQEVAPLVLSEAMASGLPAVSSAAGNAAELLGDCGSVVPIGDVDAHSAALIRLLDDADLRADMGRRARSRAEASAGKEQMVRAYETLLLELTRPGSRATDSP